MSRVRHGSCWNSFPFLIGQTAEQAGCPYPPHPGCPGDHDAATERTVTSNTHLSDWTSSFGLGGGLKIKLTEFKTDEFGDDENPVFLDSGLYLDLKVRYIFGGRAEYLREGDIEQGPNNQLILHKSQSETDYITYHIGVSFYLFNK